MNRIQRWILTDILFGCACPWARSRY